MEDNKEVVVNETTTTETKVNHLANSLARSTAQIKGDRAMEIAELAEISFKRKVEDFDRELRQLERRKKSSLDMSPDNTYSIMKVKDFEPDDFAKAYSDLGLAIREKKIQLNNAKQSYNELFGDTFTIEPIF